MGAGDDRGILLKEGLEEIFERFTKEAQAHRTQRQGFDFRLLQNKDLISFFRHYEVPSFFEDLPNGCEAEAVGLCPTYSRILKQLLVAQLIAAAIPAWRSKIARNQAIA